MEFPEYRLMIFAKAPVPGRVKTRLAGHFGSRGAARLYRRMLSQTLQQAVAAQLCPVQLWCAPDCQQGFFHQARQRWGVSLHRQPPGDLGAKMHGAFRHSLREARGVVVIGGDCASIGVAELRQALRWLHAGTPAVLGPAADGGYVLLGLSQPLAGLFQRMPWSTDRVLDLSRGRLHRAGLAWRELPLGFDVDKPGDVRRLRRLAAGQGKHSVV